MNAKVLFVDDEPHVLQSYQRNLRKAFPLEVATGGAEALECISSNGPYAVVVSDMRMPGMTGLELLTRIKSSNPDTVRIMLTGNNDQQTAADAVNQGDVFRFLNKPCSTENLVKAVNDAFEHHKLITVERSLLEETLHGAIRALAQVLALVNPDAFGRTERLERYMRTVGEAMGYAELWKLETLALLSHVGCVILPEGVIKKVAAAESLSEEESQLYSMHPNVGADLISEIPRMEDISQAIMYQKKNFDGSGFPMDSVKEQEIPLGARILRVILDYDNNMAKDMSSDESIAELKKQQGHYDPEVLQVLEKTMKTEGETTTVLVKIENLAEGMIFAADVHTTEGLLIVCKGQEATLSAKRRLMTIYENGGLGDSANVQVQQPVQ